MEQDIRFCTTSDGVRIAYATTGQGPPLVRVLGWFTHLEFEWENARWRRIHEGMASRFTYTRYDGRGMGLSDRHVSHSTVGSVSDLEAVINATGFDKVALYGVSEGGILAITYAVRNPDRVSHLIIYGGGIRPPWSEDQYDTLLSLVRQGWGSDLPAHRQFFTSLFIPDSDMEAIKAHTDMQRLSASADTVMAFLNEGREAVKAGVDLAGLLPMVKVPTLVIHRRGDAVVPFELGREIAAGIPGARFLPLDGRNHAPLAESDTPVLKTITDAIQEFIGAAPREDVSTSTSGVVTILFTDVEGSTALTQRLGDAKAQEVLHTHNTIVRDSLKAHDGSEVKHTGDGIMASFGSARQALESAITIQRSFEKHNAGNPDAQVHVRVGLNAGEPVAEDGDLFGTAVQLAARVCAHAEPGQIVIPDGLRHLVAGKDFLFADLGVSTLKGFEDPVRLFDVRWRSE